MALPGRDYLAGVKYKSTAIKAHPRGWAAGSFMYIPEWGGSLGFANKIIKKKDVPFYRFQCIWRDNHDYRGTLPEIIKLCKKAKKKVILKNPGVRFEISPTCEHKFKRKEADEYCKAVAEIFKDCPNVEVINTPWVKGGGEFSKKYKNEVHRDDNVVPRGRFNFSYDGKPCVDFNVSKDKKRYSKAEYFFLWTWQDNLLKNGKDKTRRDKRVVRPTLELFESVNALWTDKGKTSFRKGDLFKSHAEQITNNPPSNSRENKVLVISSSYASKCTIKAANGEIVAQASRYKDKYNDQWRYYFNKWGYQIAAKALKASGSPICTVYVGDEKIGKVNPIFRDGYFQD